MTKYQVRVRRVGERGWGFEPGGTDDYQEATARADALWLDSEGRHDVVVIQWVAPNYATVVARVSALR